MKLNASEFALLFEIKDFICWDNNYDDDDYIQCVIKANVKLNIFVLNLLKLLLKSTYFHCEYYIDFCLL